MRNITTVTTTAVRISVSTSIAKRTEPRLWRRCDFALERALLGGAAQRVAAPAVQRDLLDEGLLPLGEALAHFHGGHASGPR